MLTNSLDQALDAICPGVVGNPYIPHWPSPKQMLALGMHLQHEGAGAYHMMYGGAAGGGKSDWLLMCAAQYAWRTPGFSAILLRRTHTELMEPGALLDRAIEWWAGTDARYDGTSKIFYFPSGAKVSFGYMSGPTDHLRYKGGEFQLVGVDEVTAWPDALQPDYVGFSRTRSAGVDAPLRYLVTANPDGPGYPWVRDRFVGKFNPGGDIVERGEYDYLPATLYDNPALDHESYAATLMHLHPTTRAKLLAGDWSAREPGDYFRAEWFGPLLDPATDLWPSGDCVRIRWWDLAASEKQDAAFTSGVRMARHRSGVRAIEHCHSFRATPGKRDDRIIQTAEADGRVVVVGLEIEGGSGGPAQFYALEKRLKSHGFRVVGARPKAELTDQEGKRLIRTPIALTGKEGRAAPVASCLQRGYIRRGEDSDDSSPEWGLDAGGVQRDGIRLFAGPWTQSYLDIVEGFPDGATCDEVDATSGAWAWLEVHAFGGRIPPQPEVVVEPAQPQDLHPEDRPEIMTGKDRRGRWTP